jgi:uncharacterized membrane protein
MSRSSYVDLLRTPAMWRKIVVAFVAHAMIAAFFEIGTFWAWQYNVLVYDVLLILIYRSTRRQPASPIRYTHWAVAFVIASLPIALYWNILLIPEDTLASVIGWDSIFWYPRYLFYLLRLLPFVAIIGVAQLFGMDVSLSF